MTGGLGGGLYSKYHCTSNTYMNGSYRVSIGEWMHVSVLAYKIISIDLATTSILLYRNGD